jgi:hypothetical protein
MGVKRWLLLLFGGITIVSLGVGHLLVDVYRTWTFPSVVYYLTLQFIHARGEGCCLVLQVWERSRSLRFSSTGCSVGLSFAWTEQPGRYRLQPSPA